MKLNLVGFGLDRNMLSTRAWTDGHCMLCRFPAIAVLQTDKLFPVVWYCSNMECHWHQPTVIRDDGYPPWREKRSLGDGSVHAWDKFADAVLPGWDTSNRQFEVERALGARRPFGPRRKASSRCLSGQRDYCTCDTCF